MSDNERLYGKVSTNNGSYIFIEPDKDFNGRDIFAPGHELPRDTDVARGDRVSFIVGDDPKKPGKKMAVDVRFEEGQP